MTLKHMSAEEVTSSSHLRRKQRSKTYIDTREELIQWTHQKPCYALAQKLEFTEIRFQTPMLKRNSMAKNIVLLVPFLDLENGCSGHQYQYLAFQHHQHQR
ncbi:hypothetical protein MKZ38_006913 [Zalerion maritima]|uniref:Uncharacterized protein n=1 Tax=Zalerion maritima TaxID=339359 RepID=A0AAD5RV53_9PEZI|nr:hypothetical protein MKZ38_006913 [Zalerion maritima]